MNDSYTKFFSKRENKKGKNYRVILSSIIRDENRADLGKFREEFNHVYNKYVKCQENLNRLAGQAKRIDFEFRQTTGMIQKLNRYLQEKKSNYSKYNEELKEDLFELKETQLFDQESTRNLQAVEKEEKKNHELLVKKMSDQEESSQKIERLQQEKLGLGEEKLLVSSKILEQDNIIRKLQESIDQHQEEKNLCKKNMKNNALEIKTMNEFLETLTKDINSNQQLSLEVRKKISDSLENIEKIKLELEQSRETTKFKEGNIGQSTDVLKSSILSIILSKDNLQKQQKILRMLLGENSILEFRKNNVRMDLKYFDDKLAGLTKTFQRLDLDSRKVIEIDNSLSTELNKLSEEKNRHLKHNKQLLISLKKNKSKLTRTHLSMKKELNNQKVITKKNKIMLEEGKKLHTKIIVSEGEKNNLNLDMKSLVEHNESQFKKVVDSKNRVTKLENVRVSLETQITTSKEHLLKSKNEQENLLMKIENIKKEKEKYLTLINQVKKDKENLNTKYQTMKRSIKKVKERFKFSQTQIKNYRKGLTTLSFQIVQSQDDIKNNVLSLNTLLLKNKGMTEELKKQKVVVIDQKKKNIGLEETLRSATMANKKKEQVRKGIEQEHNLLQKKRQERNLLLSGCYEDLQNQLSVLNKYEKNHRVCEQEDFEELQNRIELLEKKEEQIDKVLNDERNKNLVVEISQLRNKLLKLKKIEQSNESGIKLHLHHFRKMKVLNPALYAMIEKKQKIQTRLLTLTEKLGKKNMILLEREQVFNTFREKLKKREEEDFTEKDVKIYSDARRKKKQKVVNLEKERELRKGDYLHAKMENEKLESILSKKKEKVIMKIGVNNDTFQIRPRTSSSHSRHSVLGYDGNGEVVKIAKNSSRPQTGVKAFMSNF